MNTDDFKPCPARQKMVSFNADGSQTPLFRCTESGAKMAHKNVEPSDCDACHLREELAKNMPAPKVMQSRKTRQSSSEGFLPCDDRVTVDVPHCCGLTSQIQFCESLDSPFYQQEVTPIVCYACKVRRSDAPPSS